MKTTVKQQTINIDMDEFASDLAYSGFFEQVDFLNQFFLALINQTSSNDSAATLVKSIIGELNSDYKKLIKAALK